MVQGMRSAAKTNAAVAERVQWQLATLTCDQGVRGCNEAMAHQDGHIAQRAACYGANGALEGHLHCAAVNP